jgi:hypothetical protein
MRKLRKTAHFQAVDLRAIPVVAVSNHPLRVDHPQQYRPQESPGNSQITYRAGDAGDTLRGFATGLVVQSTRAFFA